MRLSRAHSEAGLSQPRSQGAAPPSPNLRSACSGSSRILACRDFEASFSRLRPDVSRRRRRKQTSNGLGRWRRFCERVKPCCTNATVQSLASVTAWCCGNLRASKAQVRSSPDSRGWCRARRSRPFVRASGMQPRRPSSKLASVSQGFKSRKTSWTGRGIVVVSHPGTAIGASVYGASGQP